MKKLWRYYYQKALNVPYHLFPVTSPRGAVQFLYSQGAEFLQLRCLYNVFPLPRVNFEDLFTIYFQSKCQTISHMLFQDYGFINYHLIVTSPLQMMLTHYAPFTKILIIRGIGYRAAIIINEQFLDLGSVGEDRIEYTCNKYLLLRAGHSYQTYIGLFNNIGIRLLRKERKIVLYSFNPNLASLYADFIHRLRVPNTFTGRGFRFKGRFYRRKLGKRGQLKGRI